MAVAEGVVEGVHHSRNCSILRTYIMNLPKRVKQFLLCARSRVAKVSAVLLPWNKPAARSCHSPLRVLTYRAVFISRTST